MGYGDQQLATELDYHVNIIVIGWQTTLVQTKGLHAEVIFFQIRFLTGIKCPYYMLLWCTMIVYS